VLILSSISVPDPLLGLSATARRRAARTIGVLARRSSDHDEVARFLAAFDAQQSAALDHRSHA
jgi:hypothetical protein